MLVCDYMVEQIDGVFVLFFQVRLVAVEQIYLFKLSTLNIFINRFHFRLLSNQSVLHQFIM